MRNASLCRFVRGLVSVVVLFGLAMFINSCQVSQYLTAKFNHPCKDSSDRLQARDVDSATTHGSECNQQALILESSVRKQIGKESLTEGEHRVDKGKERVVMAGKIESGEAKPIHIDLPNEHLKEIKGKVSIKKPSSEERSLQEKEARKVYDRRRRRLIQSCKGKRGHVWDEKMQLIAVPDKDFTVCVVQKAGSSSWHQLIYKLREPNGTWSGKGHVENRYHGINLPVPVKHRLVWSKTATRVLTVRHPFARLISGWNNKFHKNHLMQSHSASIFRNLPGIQDYVGRHEIDEDHVIAFEDFAQYIVDTGLDKIDHHFRSIENHCLPCNFPYDYIVKAETAFKYSWWVLERANATMPTYAKHTATGSGEEGVEAAPAVTWDAERKVMAAFYKKVPLTTVQKLMDMFAIDFTRFGYTFDTHSMMAGDIID